MKKTFNKGESHQRFSIRKLSIGVASVLVGSTFMVISGEQVHADETNVDDASQKTDDNASEDQSDHVKVQSDQQDVVVTKKDQILDTADASATAKEKPDEEKTLQVAHNNANDEVKTDSQEAKVNDNGQEPGQDVPSNLPVVDNATKEEYLKALGLTQPDALTAEQLEKLGINRDTYLKDGVKYKAIATAIVQTEDGFINLGNVPTFHNQDGSLNLNYFENISQYLDDHFEENIDAGFDIVGSIYKPSYAPYVEGKTIYINEGESLDDAAARRGLPDEYEGAYKDIAWDKNIETQVDINKPGEYEGAIDITYENGVGISTGVKVVIVDLKGKTVYNSVGDPVTTDLPNLVTGQPEGSTDYHWVDGKAPGTDKVGESTGEISVTYPDGSKGTATVTIVTSNPTWTTPKTPINTVPDPSSVVVLNPGTEDMVPGTKIDWVTPPDVTKPGTSTGVVVVTYPDGTTKEITGPVDVYSPTKVETKEVIRTIIDKVPNGEAKTITQKVTFTREVTVNADGKVVKEGEWKADGSATWDAYTPAKVDGYTADPKEIASKAVTPDTANTTVTINYTKDTPNTPETPVTPPDQPTQPTTPDQPTNPETPTTPETPSVPVKPTETPSTPDNNGDVRPLAPDTPTKSNTNNTAPSKSADYDGNGNNSVRPLATHTSADNTQVKTLPQTGAKKTNGFVAAIGAAVAAVGALFGLASRKKRY
ncbi:Rib/alpha-like domain-containing protein [Lactobacillus agrestimuris]|uniref:Rib/alpha-like domain-containing protein n=1 Tax=Lactobacillus agrestimuris TaxID=2941328 RepID=UPI0024080238|nr:Rib/alpha-like domain-containing protein [Lactobacillus agrestimuris]